MPTAPPVAALFSLSESSWAVTLGFSERTRSRVARTLLISSRRLAAAPHDFHGRELVALRTVTPRQHRHRTVPLFSTSRFDLFGDTSNTSSASRPRSCGPGVDESASGRPCAEGGKRRAHLATRTVEEALLRESGRMCVAARGESAFRLDICSGVFVGVMTAEARTQPRQTRAYRRLG